MKRKLEEFLSEAELVDPDLVEFWLDDIGAAEWSDSSVAFSSSRVLITVARMAPRNLWSRPALGKISFFVFPY
jgi:hypothetical protein